MSKSWPAVRKDILQRDDYTCQDCGEPVGERSNPHLKDAEVHHKTPRAGGGSDDPENLITLCVECHTDCEPPAAGRDGRGQFALNYPNQDFLDALKTLGGIAGTQDVADEVGCTSRHALNRLQKLEEAGEVTSKDVGRSFVWMLADEGETEP